MWLLEALLDFESRVFVLRLLKINARAQLLDQQTAAYLPGHVSHKKQDKVFPLHSLVQASDREIVALGMVLVWWAEVLSYDLRDYVLVTLVHVLNNTPNMLGNLPSDKVKKKKKKRPKE